MDRDPRLPNTNPDQRDRLPPATGKGSEPKKDEVKVTDPKTAPVDADVEAHRKLDAVADETKKP
jgi:hypothetical protein